MEKINEAISLIRKRTPANLDKAVQLLEELAEELKGKRVATIEVDIMEQPKPSIMDSLLGRETL